MEISRKKDAHMVKCQNSTEENKTRHKSMKNKARKAMREMAEDVLTE